MSTALSRISRRRALQGGAAGLVTLGLLLWWVLPLGEDPPSGTITFSTGTRAGVYQEYGELLREELAKDMPQLKVRLLTSDGSQENVQRVATGRADFTIAAADAVAKVHAQGDAAHFYRATNMPESAYPTVQNGSTVPTIAVSNLLITRKDMDPRLTEWLTRTVIKSRDGIGAHVHSAQLVDLRTAIYTDPLGLHEGARRYYRSVKP